jgi:hypothetical protein
MDFSFYLRCAEDKFCDSVRYGYCDRQAILRNFQIALSYFFLLRLDCISNA